jgi:hypothetical protein
MPSPFPGMNPYLEHEDAWHNFHVLFPTVGMQQLERHIGPNYFVKADENVYIHELSGDERRLLGRPDLFTTEAPDSAGGHGPAAALLAAAPAPQSVRLPAVDVERVPYIEIRDARDRRLVSVIELLSPSNKAPGEDRDQYLTKRKAILASQAHLVEIDLLRGGRRMPLADPVSGDYGVLVSRYPDRPQAHWYPIGLRERLPVIPVPLGDDDPPVPLDLQEIVHTLYDTCGFRKYMYQTPPRPPLSAEDAAWAESLIPSGVRR